MAAIIKAGATRADSHTAQGVAFNFDDLSREASGYLDIVRSQAAQIVARANEDAKDVFRRAEERGRLAAVQAAQTAAQAKVDERLQTLIPALIQAIDEIKLTKQTWLANWEGTAVKLAVAIAERIVRRELAQKPEISLELIREALELAAGSARITLRLCPQDFALLSVKAEQLTGPLGKLAPTEIVADPQVSPGGCIVNTEFGEIDQRIESQLARIEEELT